MIDLSSCHHWSQIEYFISGRKLGIYQITISKNDYCSEKLVILSLIQYKYNSRNYWIEDKK
jgi:hypothetical protein